MVDVRHITLQRVIVRMLYDSAFAKAVVLDPSKSLKGLGLDARHIAFLTESDPRVWRLDPHRRARSLEALLEEYPTASVALAHARRSVGSLDAFFSSQHFHRCIQNRGRLALAYGDYLIELAAGPNHEAICGLSRLEREIAAFRRREEATTLHAELQLSPQVSCVCVPEGTLEFYISVRTQLGASGLSAAQAITSNALHMPPAPRLGDEVMLLLEAHPDGTGPSISQLSAELGALLAEVNGGTTLRTFGVVAGSHGAEEGEVMEILDSLISDGLILRKIGISGTR